MSEKKNTLWGKLSKKHNVVSQAVAPTQDEESTIDTPVITMENLPNAVADHLEHLVVLEDKMDVARKRARAAKEVAVAAKNKPTVFFKRKKAVEALQDSALSLANANADIMDALALSFADQRKIGEILNQMLFLCVSNLATTRSLIGQFEASLRKAQKSGYSEETKAEMARIIHELKNQEDMMVRQEKQAEVLREYGTQLKATEEHLHEHESNTNDQLTQAQKELDALSKRLDESEAARLDSEKMYRYMLIAVAVGAVILSILF